MNERLPTINQVKKVCAEFLSENFVVKKIDREGGDSAIFDISTNNKNYIFRSNGVRKNYDVEHAILKLAEQNGVKVPMAIAENIDVSPKLPLTFSVLEKILGDELEHLPLEIWPQIYKEVGSELAKLYKIKIDGYGIIDADCYRKTKKIVGSSTSWKNAVYGYCYNEFEEIKEKIKLEKLRNFSNSKLTKEQQSKILIIYGNLDNIIESLNGNIQEYEDRASLLHGDLHSEHFFVKNGHLEGIIDFNKTIVGDPLFDIAYSSIMPHGEMYEHLMKTSGVKMDMDRFALYRLLIATRKIHTRYVRFDYLHRYSEVLDVVLEELEKFS